MANFRGMCVLFNGASLLLDRAAEGEDADIPAGALLPKDLFSSPEPAAAEDTSGTHSGTAAAAPADRGGSGNEGSSSRGDGVATDDGSTGHSPHAPATGSSRFSGGKEAAETVEAAEAAASDQLVDAMAWRKYCSLAELYGFLGEECKASSHPHPCLRFPNRQHLTKLMVPLLVG